MDCEPHPGPQPDRAGYNNDGDSFLQLLNKVTNGDHEFRVQVATAWSEKDSSPLEDMKKWAEKMTEQMQSIPAFPVPRVTPHMWHAHTSREISEGYDALDGVRDEIRIFPKSRPNYSPNKNRKKKKK